MIEMLVTPAQVFSRTFDQRPAYGRVSAKTVWLYIAYHPGVTGCEIIDTFPEEERSDTHLRKSVFVLLNRLTKTNKLRREHGDYGHYRYWVVE